MVGVPGSSGGRVAAECVFCGRPIGLRDRVRYGPMYCGECARGGRARGERSGAEVTGMAAEASEASNSLAARQKRRPWLSLTLLLFVVGSFLVVVGSFLVYRGFRDDNPAYPFSGIAKGDLIAYSGPRGIHFVSEDGKASWIVPGTGSLYEPAWAPDGERFAAVDLNDCCKAYSISLDGSTKSRLPADSAISPVWSPDGRRLAVYSEDDTRIHIIPLAPASSGEVTLPKPGNNPDWAPDGKWIAFQGAGPRGDLRIFLIAANGTRLRRLTDPGMDEETEPVWSPDGQRLAFTGHSSGQDSDIYTIRADGIGLRRITSNPAQDSAPTWSPDGRRIAFDRTTDDSTAIVIVDLSTGQETEIASAGIGPGDIVTTPAWQPARRGSR
jgi:TolB protein